MGLLPRCTYQYNVTRHLSFSGQSNMWVMTELSAAEDQDAVITTAVAEVTRIGGPAQGCSRWEYPRWREWRRQEERRNALKVAGKYRRSSHRKREHDTITKQG